MNPRLPPRTKKRIEEITAPPKWPTNSEPWYDAQYHPDGPINLATAENNLLTEEFIPLLHQADIHPQHLKYRATLLRSSHTQLADLLATYVNMFNPKPIRPVTRANSVSGPGVGALMAQLVWALCGEGEGVLIPAPYYHDYIRDIVFPAQAVPVIAHVPSTIDPLSPDIIPILRERIKTSEAEGVHVRAVIFCNPHNPIPQCHGSETIQAYLQLVQEFNIHLITDELFARTVFPTRRQPTPQPFISVLSLPAWSADSPLLKNIHWLGSCTKDLGCSGLKAALLVTENEEVRKCVEVGLWATPISGATDAMLSRVLGDEELLEGLLKRNSELLGRAMDLCADWAEWHSFPYIEANAGVYFVIDFTSVVPILGLATGYTQDEATTTLVERIIKHKVYINPMIMDGDPLPYRFRLVFCQQDETLRLALSRLEAAFGLKPMPGLMSETPA